MKILINILFHLIPLCSLYAQKSSHIKVQMNELGIQNFIYEARRDSILEQTKFGSVYFTTDTTAKSYAYLNPKNIDSSIFQTILFDLTKNIESEQHVKTQTFKTNLNNSNWVTLYWFNNNFCLYSPSDWMNETSTLITDSIIYYLSSDPMLEIITNFKQLTPNTYQFTSIGYSGNYIQTKVQIIDNKRGIAIWEYNNELTQEIQKVLKVKSEYVKLLPMIICDCGNQKCVFERTYFFENPNFNQLIGTYSPSK